jgi:hypothetical protein
MAKLMSKSELIQKIVEEHANHMTRKDVKGVIETLAEIGHKELKKTGDRNAVHDQSESVSAISRNACPQSPESAATRMRTISTGFAMIL